MAKKKANRWKRENFDAPFKHLYWKRKGRELEERDSTYSCPKGAHFSVPTNAKHLLADIYFAELRRNKELKRHLNGFANFIGLLARKNPRGACRIIQEELEEKLGRRSLFHGYHCHELLLLLQDGKEGAVEKRLAEILGSNGVPPEKKLADSALPKADERIKNIQLRVLKSLDADKDHIVFEVYPMMFFAASNEPTNNPEPAEYDEEAETPF